MVAALLACAHAAQPDARLSGWRSAHPQAAGELCAFARNYPSASMRVRQWVRDHPVQAEELMQWAADNPGSPAPEAFLETAPGFRRYDAFRDPVIYALYDWATDNPDAARSLVESHALASAVDGANCGR